MDELFKKIAEAFTEYILGSLQFQEKVEAVVEGKMATLTAVDEDRVKELIDDKIVNIEERIEDIGCVATDDQRVRDIVREMDFTVEVGRY